DLANLEKEITITNNFEISEAFRNKDMLITQLVYLSSIKEFIEKGGRSRGSYLISDEKGMKPLDKLSDDFKFTLDSGELLKKACVTGLTIKDGKPSCEFEWEDIRPIPSEDNWFENVWNAYRRNEIIK
ncbi:MAG: oxidoreductase, partial [Clostridia bacterium]|nr:oxidoreductase [Clostridia bacterium]